VRENGRVVSQAIVIAIGVTSSGEREVLGLDVGPTESGAFWRRSCAVCWHAG
jgi:putative transposase